VPQSWDLEKDCLVNATDPKIKPALLGKYKAPDGTPVKTAFTIMTERYMSDEYSLQKMLVRFVEFQQNKLKKLH
jgi:hypothetical protein